MQVLKIELDLDVVATLQDALISYIYDQLLVDLDWHLKATQVCEYLNAGMLNQIDEWEFTREDVWVIKKAIRWVDLQDPKICKIVAGWKV